jgi:CBS domain-containing protein
MKVRDLVQRKGTDVITVLPKASVAQMVQLLMRHSIGAVPVVSEAGALLGMVGERDLVRAMQLHHGRVQDLSAEQVMEREVATCQAGDSLHDLMVRMTRERARHVLVLDGRSTVGIVSVGDLVKHRLEELEMETSILRDYVVANRAAL